MGKVHGQASIKLNTVPANTSLLGGHFVYYQGDQAGTVASANVVQNVDSDPANWGYNTHIGANGLQLRDGVNAKASLTTTGLVISQGGIEAGDRASTGQPSNDGYIYVSSVDGPRLSINDFIPEANLNDPQWREIIGSKFGVLSDGTLYASGVNVSGAITASSLTIGSGSSTYNGIAAINVSGYDIQIINDPTGVVDIENTTYLYPVLYHNGIKVDSGIDYSKFVWYQDNDTTGTEGDDTNYGRILATYGHTYRVVYDFDDGAVGSGSEIQVREVDPQKYITKIDDYGITIHPENQSLNNYMRLDSDSLKFYKDNINVAKYGANIRIGSESDTHVIITDGSVSPYIAAGMYLNDNNTVLAKFTESEVQIGLSNSGHVLINDNSININDDINTLATFTSSEAVIGQSDGGHVLIDSNSVDINDGINTLATFTASGAQIGQDGQSRLIEDYHSIKLIDKNENEFFVIKDLRDSSGYATINEEFVLTSENLTCSLKVSPSSIISVTVDGQETSAYTLYSSTIVFNSSVLSLGSTAEIIYTSDSQNLKSYVLGIRGPYSGQNGCYSVIEGRYGTANGNYSHTEGYGCHADGNTAHSGGDYSHANGEASLAHGHNVEANDWDSVVFGRNTICNTKQGLVIGRMNIADPVSSYPDLDSSSVNGNLNIPNNYCGKYALIIGNGDPIEDIRSNALTVDWLGRISNNNYMYGSWINGRDLARIQLHPAVSSASHMHPYISMKTYNGAWQISTYTNNTLQLMYTTDANYSTGTNTATGAYIQTNGTYTTSSDRKLKENITDLTYAKELIMNLRPVEFNFKNCEYDRTHMGFIAQEVAQACKNINKDLSLYSAIYNNPEKHNEKDNMENADDNELIWMLAYSELIAPLVQVVQELESRVMALEQQNNQ